MASAPKSGKFANGAVTGAYVVLFNHAMHQGQQQEPNPHEDIERQLSEKLSKTAKQIREFNLDPHNQTRDTELLVGFNLDGIENDTRFQKDFDVLISIENEDGKAQKLSVTVRTHLAEKEVNNMGVSIWESGYRSGEGLHYAKGYAWEIHNKNTVSIITISFQSKVDSQKFKSYIWPKND